MDVINRLKFDPKCIGSDLMALSVKPVYICTRMEKEFLMK